MPTDQPSSAPDGLPADAREGDTAAAVLADDALDQPPGGGGLRGPAGADPLAGSAPRGTAPNSPVDLGVAPPDEGRGRGRRGADAGRRRTPARTASGVAVISPAAVAAWALRP